MFLFFAYAVGVWEVQSCIRIWLMVELKWDVLRFLSCVSPVYQSHLQLFIYLLFVETIDCGATRARAHPLICGQQNVDNKRHRIAVWEWEQEWWKCQMKWTRCQTDKTYNLIKLTLKTKLSPIYYSPIVLWTLQMCVRARSDFKRCGSVDVSDEKYERFLQNRRTP